ncbi:MAG: hypothetical protein OXU45_04820 [Candidatus Melainabacteria bacterium]|nr:hypothetical protein [Candidatus Melainabacteria bacterium]
MELNSTRFNERAAKKDLKKLFKEFGKADLLGLEDVETIYTRALIDDLVEVKHANKDVDDRQALTELYRHILINDEDRESSFFDFGFEALSEIVTNKEDFDLHMMRLDAEKQRQAEKEAWQHSLYSDFGYIFSEMGEFTVSLAQLEKLSEEDKEKLREMIAINKQRAKFVKYIADFKQMLKLFTPKTAMAQATESLIASYEFKLGQI